MESDVQSYNQLFMYKRSKVCSIYSVNFYYNWPTGIPFYPHIHMENKLEENIKEKERIYLEKEPKRIYRSPGNISKQWQDLLPRAHQGA